MVVSVGIKHEGAWKHRVTDAFWRLALFPCSHIWALHRSQKWPGDLDGNEPLIMFLCYAEKSP